VVGVLRRWEPTWWLNLKVIYMHYYSDIGCNGGKLHCCFCYSIQELSSACWYSESLMKDGMGSLVSGVLYVAPLHLILLFGFCYEMD